MTELEKQLNDYVGRAHFMKDYCLSLVSAEKGHVRLSAPVSQRILNNFGVVHGGFYMSISDTAAGLAALTDGRHYVSQNASYQFLGNVTEGTVFLEATVLHCGKTVVSVRTEVFDASGKLLCEGLFSMFAVQKEFLPV